MRPRVEPGAIFAAIHEDEAHGPRITEAAFRPIADEYNIPLSDVEQVRLSLNAGASAYLYARSVEKSGQDQPSYQDIEREISHVRTLTANLKSALEHLSEVAAALFDDMEHVASMEMLAEFETRGTSSFGHPFYRIGEGRTYLNRHQIVLHIGVLENMAKHILSVMKPTNKGGRPPNEAMPCWVNNVYIIWTRTLGRQFSFYEFEGEPNRESATAFCWETLLLIDRCPSRSAFRTAMRDAVRLEQISRGRRRRRSRKSQKSAQIAAGDIASASC
jgi:hypothetical protein